MTDNNVVWLAWDQSLQEDDGIIVPKAFSSVEAALAYQHRAAAEFSRQFERELVLPAGLDDWADGDPMCDKLWAHDFEEMIKFVICFVIVDESTS